MFRGVRRWVLCAMIFTIQRSFAFSAMKRPASALGTTALFSSTAPASDQRQVPLVRSEGLLAVYKPPEWTSNDVVSYIRGILERDARNRGAKPVRPGSRKNKNRVIKVGHGGTLDPLATGVLVIGVGKGTKQLQDFLSGSKGYVAAAEFGFETNTLDMDPAGNVTKRADFDHVTKEKIEAALPKFRGDIEQIPPMFSALSRGGKKLYDLARQGATAEEMGLEPRAVHVHKMDLTDAEELPKFHVDIECGGGTYVRCLIRDLAYELDSVATMTELERTKQGQFTIEDCLVKDDWNADNIYDAIDKFTSALQDGSVA